MTTPTDATDAWESIVPFADGEHLVHTRRDPQRPWVVESFITVADTGLDLPWMTFMPPQGRGYDGFTPHPNLDTCHSRAVRALQARPYWTAQQVREACAPAALHCPRCNSTALVLDTATTCTVCSWLYVPVLEGRPLYEPGQGRVGYAESPARVDARGFTHGHINPDTVLCGFHAMHFSERAGVRMIVAQRGRYMDDLIPFAQLDPTLSHLPCVACPNKN